MVFQKKHIKKLKELINSKCVHTLVLDNGERSKSFSSFKKIIDKLFELRFDRSDVLIAFGGGVVGDITGFSASTFFKRH